MAAGAFIEIEKFRDRFYRVVGNAMLAIVVGSH
jgi:hypothetical protein